MKQNTQTTGKRVNGSSALADEDTAVMAAIKEITRKGNDVMVKRKRDGKLHVYEVKSTLYP